ncbi:two-component regulator propeller domain-containing protein [Aureibaculum sp. 2210JD6-5]|uniref:type IX secretion system anionic LPS delivery protein PorZ n=1 Tax=Aureibaculum sp. 2210JD6-5 TaxID=3103957 RepID=UPI002AAEF062|nr:two-component regulator propeller domain-containing protein [Aureibaculum sp. 2210JD6-5]MDY7394693.1 two-component regulator propeller domain-containing protein [Aureibaculum sp. 2210JD6-5]
MIKKNIFLFTLMFAVFGRAQTDFSANWEDFYSYNNVKDFIKTGSKVYAVTDNAVFIYDEISQETEKLSSVQGLSGEATSSIYYSEAYEKLVIGYQNGLLEIIDEKGKITLANDIQRLSITGEKAINHITEHGDKLYFSTPFAVVVYDIEKLEYQDTYFIGNNSSTVNINQIAIFNDLIYAATENGIYTADVNSNSLIDFNNWQQPQGDFVGDFKTITVFNDQLFTSRFSGLYKVNGTSLQFINFLADNILQLKASENYLTATTRKSAYVYNNALSQQVITNTTPEHDYVLQSAYAEGNSIYLGTSEFGILHRSFSNGFEHTEIHPQGPISNDIFSITAENNHIWVVYGGYDAAFTPLQSERAISHFNTTDWINIPYGKIDPVRDLVHVTLDPENPEKAYISSFGQNDTNHPDATGGMLVVENNEVIAFWNHTNSGLEDLAPNNPNYSSVRINGSAFDNRGNFWISNSWVNNKLKKLSPEGTWSSFDLSSIFTNVALGLTELVIDRSGNIWIGSRRNGALVYNESGDRKRALVTEATKGSLPDPNVRSLAVDRNNRIWIGTKKGLVVFSNAGGVFDDAIYDASPVIIEDDGIAKKLLGDQPVSSIAIDGADNKWFGTDTGGVLATNPSGQETLFNFNESNSPLPSNKIIKIKVDNSNGKVFFATDKGLVAFNNNVAPFGDGLGEVYAYPNPVKKEHAFVTIDGRNGTHLPRGTNVKILDASGRLVHETNVIEGQELKGGKVIWDKTNLAGRKVASGVYVVLLTIPDKSETSITKIAIIN